MATQPWPEASPSLLAPVLMISQISSLIVIKTKRQVLLPSQLTDEETRRSPSWGGNPGSLAPPPTSPPLCSTAASSSREEETPTAPSQTQHALLRAAAMVQTRLAEGDEIT